MKISRSAQKPLFYVCSFNSYITCFFSKVFSAIQRREKCEYKGKLTEGNKMKNGVLQRGFFSSISWGAVQLSDTNFVSWVTPLYPVLHILWTAPTKNGGTADLIFNVDNIKSTLGLECKCKDSMTVECHKRMSDLGGHKPTLKGHSKGFGSKKGLPMIWLGSYKKGVFC